MDINFSIDFEENTVFILVDNHLSLSVTKYDNEYAYAGFDRLDDSDTRSKLKTIAKLLLSLGEE